MKVENWVFLAVCLAVVFSAVTLGDFDIALAQDQRAPP